MNIQKTRSVLLMGALLLQSFFLSVAPQVARAVDEPVLDPAQPRLVISAVQITGGTGKTHEDFIELFNPSDAPFNLNGHRLVKRTAVGTTDTVVKAWSEDTIVLPNQFYLWANSGFSTIQTSPDSATSATLADNNGIALRFGENNVGEVMDALSWGSTANGFDNVSSSNPAASESLARVNLFSNTAEFHFRPSLPRNSSVIFEPPSPQSQPLPNPEPAPEEDPESAPEEETPAPSPAPTPSPEPTSTPAPTPNPTPAPQPQSQPQPAVVNVKINELMPNPVGADSGFERVELFNAGEAKVNLQGYKLDDVSAGQPISSNAYVLPNLEIPAGAYLAITIPAGKMALNNTGGDVLTLFKPTGEMVSTIFYEGTAPEGKSYSYFSVGWRWAEPTFGTDNGRPPVVNIEEEDEEDDTEEVADYDNSGLEITEIFPQPDSTGTEFVEIYNSGDEVAQLSKVAVYVGDRKKLLPEFSLQPGAYFAIEKTNLPVQLRNSGQVVKLQEDATVLSTVEYPQAILNASFAKFEDGFLWTTKVTKSADNILEIPEVVKKQASADASKTTAKKAVAAKSTAKTSATKSATASATAKPASPATAKTNSQQTKPESSENLSIESPKKQKEPLGKIFAMGAAAVVGGVVALYRFVITAGVE